MPEQKEIEMRVLECPLMIEDKASLTWVTLAFCTNCEYHEGVEQGFVICSANDHKEGEQENAD